MNRSGPPAGAARQRRFRPPVCSSLIGLLLALFSPVGSALTSDREQPIHIEADRVQIDDTKGLSIYTGNVIYTQGSIRLEADIVHLYYTQDRRIERLEADGNPARFRQRLEGENEDVRAEALHIEYYAEPGRLILSRDAHVWRLNTEFSGEVIEYDAAQDRISAARAANGEGRVRVVIQPEPGKTNGNGNGNASEPAPR